MWWIKPRGTEARHRWRAVARQVATLAAAGLVCELKANREDEGEDELDKRFGVAHEGKIGRLIVEVDGDRAVFACRSGTLSHVSSPCRWPLVRMRHPEDNVLKDQAYYKRLGASPLNPMESGSFFLVIPRVVTIAITPC